MISSAFLSSAYFFFFKIIYIEIYQYSFRNAIGVSNSLDPDLGPKCLQRFSADDISRQEFK